MRILPTARELTYARRGTGRLTDARAVLHDRERRALSATTGSARARNYNNYDGLRISVGTDAEIDRLLMELRKIV